MSTRRVGTCACMSVLPCVLLICYRLVAQNCAVSPPELSHLWPGEQDASDVVGGSDGATQNGATFAQAMVGDGFSFDGTSFVAVPNAPDLQISSDSPSTLDAWVFPTAFAPTLYTPLTATKAYYFGLLFSPDRHHLRGHVHDGNHWIFADGPYELPLKRWTHVAQTWDGTTLTIYANGEVIGSGAFNGLDDPRTEGPLLIGRWEAPVPRNEHFPFIGIVDEVGVYTRALTASEVQAIFTAGSSGTCTARAIVQPRCGFAPTEVRTSFAGSLEFTTINWSFGDGEESGELEATHLYTSPGTYSVTATLATANGEVTLTAGDVVVFDSSPQARFSASSLVGPVPLNVQFTDESTGQVVARHWDFGDGATSNEINPAHTFNAERSYEVRLTVTGACSESPANESVATTTVVVGSLPYVEFVQTSPRCMSVRLASTVPFFGGEIGIAYDPDTVSLGRVRRGPDLPAAAQLLLERNPPVSCGPETRVEAGLTLGWINSGDGSQSLPAGTHELFVLCFNAAPGADIGACSALRFVSCLGVPEAPVRNILTVANSVSAALFTSDGELCIQPDQPFRRGDPNADGSFDISDPIGVLNCLFLGSQCTACRDAADSDDDGVLNITDPIYLLNWRFTGGPAPPPPFPGCGVDVGVDDLDECGSFTPCP